MGLILHPDDPEEQKSKKKKARRSLSPIRSPSRARDRRSHSPDPRCRSASREGVFSSPSEVSRPASPYELDRSGCFPGPVISGVRRCFGRGSKSLDRAHLQGQVVRLL